MRILRRLNVYLNDDYDENNVERPLRNGGMFTFVEIDDVDAFIKINKILKRIEI
jgi:hypothetical protein